MGRVACPKGPVGAHRCFHFGQQSTSSAGAPLESTHAMTLWVRVQHPCQTDASARDNRPTLSATSAVSFNPAHREVVQPIEFSLVGPGAQQRRPRD